MSSLRFTLVARPPGGTKSTKHEQPDTYVTVPLRGEEGMHWKECSVTDERLQFVARRLYSINMAERVGFEPTVEFPLHTLSKRAP